MHPDQRARPPADSTTALLARIAVLADLGRWRDALPLLHEALALDPSNPAALGQLARARLGTDDHRGALEAADQLVAVRPDGDWGHRLRSIALHGRGVMLLLRAMLLIVAFAFSIPVLFGDNRGPDAAAGWVEFAGLVGGAL